MSQLQKFLTGLSHLQSHNRVTEPDCGQRIQVMIEDGDLIWAWIDRVPTEDDARDLERLGWETSDGIAWTFRLKEESP